MYYQIQIEKWNEEFELIEETETLEEAINIAKNIPIEKYKTIMIFKVDYNGTIMQEMEVEYV